MEKIGHGSSSYTDNHPDGKLKCAYEQSVNAYQSHVQRYNTWMNMYAVITGALFVAFYSMYGDSDESLSKDIGKFLPILISCLGLVCSLCWFGVVKGHYEWMKSFMQILKHNEKLYFGTNNPNAPFVYSKVIVNKNKCPKSGNYLYGFYSTQKITLVFTSLVALAWGIVTTLAVAEIINSTPPCTCCFIVGLIICCIIAYICRNIIMKKASNNFHSTIQSEEIIMII